MKCHVTSSKSCFILNSLLVCFVMLPLFAAGSQQDTLKISIREAENIFLQNNMSLLAEHLNISQADALILQAKTWPNPVFELNDVQLYNKSSTDPSPGLAGTTFWQNRTLGAQLEQMIQLAGKRKKNIVLETRNKEVAENMFSDLLLSLKAEFRQRLSELGYNQKVIGDVAYQLEIVADLLKAQEIQYKSGNISQSALFRLKALYISLQSDQNGLSENISNLQQQLKTLMALPPEKYLLLTDDKAADSWLSVKSKPLEELLTLARENNAAAKAAYGATKVRETQLSIEKARAVPDINFMLNYDRNGNNQLDFLGAGFSMELPFFNRNRGNIKAAAIEVEKSKLLQNNKTLEISNAVVKNWEDLNKAIRLYENIDADYLKKLDDMMKAVSENFIKRNISLLEFMDMFSSFKESKEQYYRAIHNIMIKKEELNYLTASEL